jgi:hypothetical protein
MSATEDIAMFEKIVGAVAPLGYPEHPVKPATFEPMAEPSLSEMAAG